MPDNAPKILFLAAHVQPFLLAGISMLVKNHNAEVLVVCWPVPESSPTPFLEDPNVAFIVKHKGNTAEIAQLVMDFNADIVWGSGWMDKDYLRWCKRYNQMGRHVVMGMDNQWKGTLKQHVNCWISGLFLKKIYTHAWVPGKPQQEYAQRLGFPKDKVLVNLYIVDTNLFHKYYINTFPAKEKAYPKSLLYAGRLVDHKVSKLLEAFSSLSEEERAGWKLTVLGNGSDSYSKAYAGDHIVFKSFIQQEDLEDTVREEGIFCLTSSEEPWGMVIQEFAAAGLPLLVSIQCGAQHAMVSEGINGFLCDGEVVADIRKQLLNMISLPDQVLLEMGRQSNKIATATDPQLWAATLMSVTNNN